jgi:hypothetical protein
MKPSKRNGLMPIPIGSTSEIEGLDVVRSGEILIDETRVPVRFTLRREGSEGHLSAERSEHFATLLKIFGGDESVILVEPRSGWRARVDIWEPSKVPDVHAEFRFRVLELL